MVKKIEKNKLPPVLRLKVPEKPKKTETEIAEEKRIAGITKKRNNLINEIKPKLMSNGALRRGGPGNRSKYAQEIANYTPVIAEINELGRLLSIRAIGLGNLRG